MSKYDFFSESELQQFISSYDWVYENAGTDWRDGILLGGGSIGAVAYAPGHMEWVINKLDVFDARVPKVTALPHDKVMKYFHDNKQKDVCFLDDMEKSDDEFRTYSLTPVILRLHLGNGDMGWNAPAFPAVSQRLSFYEGELYSNIDAHFMHSKAKNLTPHGQNLFVLRLEGCSISDWEHTIEIYRPYHDAMDLPVFHRIDNGICFEQVLPGGIGQYAVALLAVNREPDRGRVSYQIPESFDYEKQKSYISPAEFSKLCAQIQQGGDMDLYIAVCSSYEYDEPLAAAEAEVREAAKRGFLQIEAEHRLWWADYWQRSIADFGKHKEIQRYWLFSKYEIACSYGKAPIPTLNGLAYGPLHTTTPGVASPCYVHDQNVQIPVMPFAVLNHPEFIIPLIETYQNASDTLRANTRYLFEKSGGDGIFLPLAMNQHGEEIPAYSYRYTMCGSAYTGLMLCWIWKYSHDINLMRDKIYTLLCELVRFYVNNLMQLGDDDLYHLDWSIPPEIFTMTRDDSATLSMLKICLQTTVEVSNLLGIKNAELDKWQEILKKYPPIAKNRGEGWWGGPDIPPDHFCYGAHLLYPFFPSEAYISSEEKETAKKTIKYFEDFALERSYADTDGQFHSVHDWSWLLTTVSRFRLGDKERAFKELNRFLLFYSKPNGLFSHNSVVMLPPEITEENHKYIKGQTADPVSPSGYNSGRCATPNPNASRLVSPVLEGNSAFLLCSTEMLLQSFDGIIRLFPGVPDDFCGKFQRLAAQGGFEVSAVMENGKVTVVQIKSLAGGTAKLYNPWGNKSPLPNAELQAEGSDFVLSVPMSQGQMITLLPNF